MPPTQINPLTPTDYLLYNDMITRIRTLEHIAIARFFESVSDRSNQVRLVKQRVAAIQRRLHHPAPIGNSDLLGAAVTVTTSADALRCNFPLCPSGGTCQVCGLDQAHQQLIADLASINQVDPG